MSKSVMIIDTPIDCCDCPFGTMAFGKSVCLLDEGNGIECPLKPYKDFVPIEWIEKKLNCCDNINAEIFVKALIRDWEEENDFATNSRVGNRCNGDNDSNISSTTNSGVYKESIIR